MTTMIEHSLTSDQIEQYHREGYFVARGLFKAHETAALRDHFNGMHDMATRGEGLMAEHYHPVPLEETGGDLLQHFPRIMNPHHFEARVREAILDRRFEVIVRALMGEEALAAQSMLYFKPPGARGQALHQDNFYLKVAPGTCMAAWLALDDTDEHNGGLSVVPGSHRLDVLCPHVADFKTSFTIEEVDVPMGMEPVPVCLQAGDVLFFNGSVIHGSGPNLSQDRFRRSFICHYLPISATELSDFYSLMDFDGKPVRRETAEGGGPCGTEAAAALKHGEYLQREALKTARITMQ